MTALLVAVGAALGAVVRLLVARRLPGPRSTLLVNVAGSLLLGLVAGVGEAPYALLGTGFCGALTTFSTFAVEVADGEGARHLVVTAAGCLGACALGLGLAAALP